MRAVAAATVTGVAALASYILLPHSSKVFPLIRRLSSMATGATTSSSARPVETFSMAFVTAPSEDTARSLASGLVSSRLAACVNILPGVTSVYEWEGEVNTDSEVLMMIKTRTSRIPELTEYVQKHHPYDVPEVITTSIEGGSRPYLDWLAKNVPEVSTEI